MNSLTQRMRTGLSSFSKAWPLFARKAVRANVTEGGYQEARVRIHCGYEPRTLEVLQGVPLRLYFKRDEDAPCSERVIFSEIGIDRRLPAFKETTIEFIPRKAGTFLFTCHMGMYRGRLIVRPAKSQVGSPRGGIS